MTFEEIQTEAATRLNLTSTEAYARLGSFINIRYRRLTSSLGLSTSRRMIGESDAILAGDTTASFDLEKLELVYTTAAGRRRMLREIPYEDYRIRSVEEVRTGDPTEYCIISTAADSVTIGIYPTPAANITIFADGLSNAAVLADDDVPNIPVDFHDTLILGAMADELFKMEKYPLAADKQSEYEMRVSDLRLFLAKSAYLSMAEVSVPGGLVTVNRKRWQS